MKYETWSRLLRGAGVAVLLVASAASALWAAEGSSLPLEGSSLPAGESDSEPSQLGLKLSIAETAPGVASFRLDVTNSSENPVELEFPTQQLYDLVVRDRQSGDVVWQWSDEEYFDQEPAEKTLQPGEVWSVSHEWEFEGTAQGVYVAEAFVAAEEELSTGERLVSFLLPVELSVGAAAKDPREVNLRLEVKNLQQQPLEIPFDSDKVYDFVLRDRETDEAVWTWSEGRDFGRKSQVKTLSASDGHPWSFEERASLPEGKFTLEAVLAVEPALRNRTELEVTADGRVISPAMQSSDPALAGEGLGNASPSATPEEIAQELAQLNSPDGAHQGAGFQGPGGPAAGAEGAPSSEGAASGGWAGSPPAVGVSLGSADSGGSGGLGDPASGGGWAGSPSSGSLPGDGSAIGTPGGSAGGDLGGGWNPGDSGNWPGAVGDWGTPVPVTPGVGGELAAGGMPGGPGVEGLPPGFDPATGGFPGWEQPKPSGWDTFNQAMGATMNGVGAVSGIMQMYMMYKMMQQMNQPYGGAPSGGSAADPKSAAGKLDQIENKIKGLEGSVPESELAPLKEKANALKSKLAEKDLKETKDALGDLEKNVNK